MFSSVLIACHSVRHYPFYSSIQMAKQTILTANQTIQIIYSPIRMVCLSVRNFYSSVRTANQTVQIIYSPVWMVCLSVRNFYLSVQTADQTVQIIYSSVRTVRQTVRTLQGPFVNHVFLLFAQFSVSVCFAFQGHIYIFTHCLFVISYYVYLHNHDWCK